MFATISRRIASWVSKKDRTYLLLGVLCLLGSVTLTAHAILTVSNSGLLGDGAVTVDGAGALSLGTASSTAVVIGQTGIPVSIPGNLTVTGTFTLGSASTTGQLLFHIASSSFTTLLQASSSQASNLTFTLPATAGTAGQAISTDGAGNLFFANPSLSQWLNGTSGTISYSSGSIGINTTTPVALLSIVGSSTSPASLFNIASSSGASLFNVSSNGNVTVGNALPVVLPAGVPTTFVCDGSNTDRTADLIARILSLYTTGGGSIHVVGSCTIAGDVLLPNSGGADHPTQPYIRIYGDGATSNGYWGTPPACPSALKFTSDAASANLETRGAGLFELDHICLQKTATGVTSPIFKTTNTTVHLHDYAVMGPARDCAAVSCGVGVVFGGEGTTVYGTATDAVFQGYGSYSRFGYFANLTNTHVINSAANSVVIDYETISSNVGNPSGGAIILQGPHYALDGVVLQNNLIESAKLKWGIEVRAGASLNIFSNNSCWDGVPGTMLACVHFASGAVQNIVYPGYPNATPDLVDANATPSNSFMTGTAGHPAIFLNPVTFVTQPTILGGGGPKVTDASGDVWFTTVSGTAGINNTISYTPNGGSKQDMFLWKYLGATDWALGCQSSGTCYFDALSGSFKVRFAAGGLARLGEHWYVDASGNTVTDGTAKFGAGGSATKIVCWKSDGKTMGWATMTAGDISACN